MKTYQLFINHEWVDSASGETVPVLNPATEEVVAMVQEGTPADAEKALQAAQAAFATWKKLPPRARAEKLYRLAAEIRANADSLAELLVREQGKLLRVARKWYVPWSAT